MNNVTWVIESPRKDVPTHPNFKTLEEVRQFLRDQKVTIKDDKGWMVRELHKGIEAAKCHAAILVSDQGADSKTIIALTVRD